MPYKSRKNRQYPNENEAAIIPREIIILLTAVDSNAQYHNPQYQHGYIEYK